MGLILQFKSFTSQRLIFSYFSFPFCENEERKIWSNLLVKPMHSPLNTVTKGLMQLSCLFFTGLVLAKSCAYMIYTHELSYCKSSPGKKGLLCLKLPNTESDLRKSKTS